jgi:hypothetical protein
LGHLQLARLDWPRGVHRPVIDLEAEVERAAAFLLRHEAARRAIVDPAPAPSLERHWVEIELLDETDCAVADERYEVILPTGRAAKGRLDPNGHARLE